LNSLDRGKCKVEKEYKEGKGARDKDKEDCKESKNAKGTEVLIMAVRLIDATLCTYSE
jgi:hypothetical protein